MIHTSTKHFYSDTTLVMHLNYTKTNRTKCIFLSVGQIANMRSKTIVFVFTHILHLTHNRGIRFSQHIVSNKQAGGATRLNARLQSYIYTHYTAADTHTRAHAHARAQTHIHTQLHTHNSTQTLQQQIHSTTYSSTIIITTITNYYYITQRSQLT